MGRRVLHVIPAVAPRYGGPSTAVFGICEALQQVGASPIVATTDADGPRRLPVPLGDIQPYCGIPTIFFRRRWSESFKWSPDLTAWVDGHVHQFDVVHLHAVFSHSTLAAGRACLAMRVPYVIRPLGSLDPWSMGRHRRRKQLLLSLGLRRVLTGATAFHYTSDQEQKLAEAAFGWLPNGFVVPLGIDDALLSTPVRAAADPYVLTLSRLDSKKGIDVLIRAFHDLAADENLRAWRLVIAGDGDSRHVSQLRTLAASGPAAKRITFRGWVAGDERVSLLRGARLFALPSHQENFGMAVVEAMACGVPVVVTPGVNLSADIVSAQAGWLSERTPDALSHTLAAAMATPFELKERGQRARGFARQFRWSEVGRQLRAAYASAIGGVQRAQAAPGAAARRRMVRPEPH